MADAPRVVLHVGAPKTGSTFLQNLLWANRTALLEGGVHLVGAGTGDHARAAQDLRGRERTARDPRPRLAGSWDLLASLAASSRSPLVVVSDEHLAGADDAQVSRAVQSMAPRATDVIVVARHPASALASAWQERIKWGGTEPFSVWAGRRLRPGARSRAFWAEHDPADIVSRWSRGVGRSRVHLVPLPGPGADRDELWRRFCDASGIDAARAPQRPAFANESLGIAEAEFQRRVNLLLPSDFGAWNHLAVSRNVLGNQVLAARRGQGRPALPADLLGAAQTRVAEALTALADSGCVVHGQLGELLVPPSGTQPQVDEQAVVDVACAVAPQLATRLADPGTLVDLAQRAAADRDLDGCLTVTAEAVQQLATESARATRGATATGLAVRARSRVAGLADRSLATARWVDRIRARRRPLR